MRHYFLGLLVIAAGYWNLKRGNHQSHDGAHLHGSLSDSYLHDLLINGSSVWCHGENRSTRQCRFSNLCYKVDSRDFVFLLSPKSVFMGVASGSSHFPLVDLTSVQELNTLSINLVHVPTKAINTFPVHYFQGETFLLGRFKPDNIMHVFHDDLFPLYATFHELCYGKVESCIEKHTLALFDINPSHQFLHLYQLFSKNPVILTQPEHFKLGTLTCFQYAFAGLSRHSLWYEYGFTKPQGPKVFPSLNGEFIHGFSQFIYNKLNISVDCGKSSPYAVFLGRKSTRLVVNSEELVNAIVNATNYKVFTAYLETDDLKQIIGLVSCAEMLVGVHGAHLTLTVFLKRGATLLELFPYAVPPEDYTPFKTLAALPGMGIIYKSWENIYPQNTVTYPSRPPELGGLLHLDAEERTRIQQLNIVPRHLCCSDPVWLYRIYQDTIVDIPSFLQVTQVTRTVFSTESTPHLYPGTVQNLICSASKGRFRITWDPPWNLKFIEANNVMYEIWIQEVNPGSPISAFRTNDTSYVLKSKKTEELNCWVACLSGSKTGRMMWTICKKFVTKCQ